MAERVVERVGFRLGLRERLRRFAPTSGAAHEIRALDGLRALAILLVLVHHFALGTDLAGSGPHLFLTIGEFAFVGVLLFFALSGFLLFLPYARALLVDGQSWPSTMRFYERRALRILPVHLSVLVVLTVLLALRVSIAGRTVTSPNTLALDPATLRGLGITALLLQNMSLSATIVARILNGPLWTLALEWQFYLVLPWVALALARLAGTRSRGHCSLWKLCLGLAAIMGIGLGMRAISAVDYAVNPPANIQTLVQVVCGIDGGRYIELFAVGMLLSALYVAGSERGWLRRRSVVALGGLLAAGAPLGVLACRLWAQNSQVFQIGSVWNFPPPRFWAWSVAGYFATGICFALLLWGVLTGPVALRRLFAWGPLRFIGIISYSIYLWHQPIISLLYHWQAILVAIVVVSVASYYLIERPFITLRVARADPQHAAATAATRRGVAAGGGVEMSGVETTSG